MSERNPEDQDPFQAMAYRLLDEGHLEPDDIFSEDPPTRGEQPGGGWLSHTLRRLLERLKRSADQ